METPGTARLPQCLDLHYEEDFLDKQSHQVPVVFSDPLFIPSMANAMYEAFKPPVLPKASPFTGGCRAPSTSGQTEDGGPEPEKPEPERPEPARSEPGMSAPSTSRTSQQVQEPVTEAPDTDSNKASEHTPEQEPPHQGPKVKVTRRLQKRGSKAMAGDSKDGATPSKVRKEMEAGDANEQSHNL